MVKPSTDAAPEPAAAEKPKKKDGTRETIESVVVAFILAFLFRTFEAEAFVIPTGSMAPTLFGRHKDVHCPQCGTLYQIGASEEVDNVDGLYISSNRVKHAACPNCRYVAEIKDAPVFKGDRILVNKFMYELSDPQRWDVVVFKYPEDPKTNYIKRLIGLPGETIEIRQGDIYVHRDGKIEIQRKPDPNKQKDLQMLVYDNDHPERALLSHGWPERWGAVKRDSSANSVAGWSNDEAGWKTDADKRTASVDAADSKEGFRWFRYRHYVPHDEDWNAVTGDPPRDPRAQPRPELITDYCGYNAYDANLRDMDVYWVGDLTLNATLEVTSAPAGSQAMIELVEGSRRYRCRFQLDTGKAELLMLDDLARGDDQGTVLATAETPVKGTGTWIIAFANVDDRLCLWVDDRIVDFGKGNEEGVVYQPFAARGIQRPWEEDLTPVGIAAQGASIQVSHLVIQRDVYYRGEYIRPQDAEIDNSAWVFKEYLGDVSSLRKLVSDPEKWGELYEKRWIRNDSNIPESAYVFPLSEDEYLMMGDNSPRSKDSRLWPQGFRGPQTVHRHAVKRSALVGKAFFIYWPHGVPFLNDGRGYPDDGDSILNNSVTGPFFYHTEPKFNKQGQFVGTQVSPDDYPSFRIPFYPNIGRMHRIR